MPGRVDERVLARWREVDDLARRREALLRGGAPIGHRVGVGGAERPLDLDAVGRLDDDIRHALDGLRDLVDPCDASPDVPLVLLPVRLETTYAVEDGSDVLRVRIFPDDLHVDDLPRGLTEAEAEAGRAYWTEVWRTDGNDGTDGGAIETARAALDAAVSPDRAAWVAAASTPTNPEARGQAAPLFPPIAGPTTRTVVARALPDAFCVVVDQEGVGRVQQTGRPVPRDLPMSPVLLAGDRPASAADLDVPEGSEWLVDYDAAVAVGMAVTVPLQGGTAPVRRVVAVGTRSTAEPDTGAAELEDLLAGHRYGGGLGLLPQGTPTNNADAARSPYRPHEAPTLPPSEPVPAVPGSDTGALAGILGLDPALLAGLLGHGSGEQTAARSANTALWAPGWGAYLDMLDRTDALAGLDDSQREWARRLFRDHVRGRGPAPALRVRGQVYGVLPVTDLGRWRPGVRETTRGVVSLLRPLLARWSAAATGAVDRLRPEQEGLDEAMLEVLGSSPVMQGLRVRPFVLGPLADVGLPATGVDPAAYAAERFLRGAVMAEVVGASIASKVAHGSLDDEDRPLPLPLVSERDPAFIAALLGEPSEVLDVDSVLQALLALAWQSSEVDTALTSPPGLLSELVSVTALDEALAARVVADADRADRLDSDTLLSLADELEVAGGVVAAGPAALRRQQAGLPLSSSLAEVVLAAPEGPDRVSMAGATVAGWFRQHGYRAEVREAMQHLATVPVGDRRLAVGEALDCHATRLDAWVTAVAADRRARQARRRGLTLGAWGVVEHLAPADPRRPDGWLLAPSTRHATAAGILRNAHLSHPPPGHGPGPFALDLSSARLDRARALLDGVRSGQQLTALVGYQLERGLAERGLARLQLSLRRLAPLVGDRLHATPDGETAEAVAARDVVDGLTLLDRYWPRRPAPGAPPPDPEAHARAHLRPLLEAAPDNVYLEPGDWPGLDDAEWRAVTQVLSGAADTVDALADLLLAEAVLQHAGGNPARAAAAMDALGPGADPAAEIDVLETQDPAERLTHRVLAVVGASATSGAVGWDPERPRALAEPRLEAWAAAHLGDPASVVVTGDPGGPAGPGAAVTLDRAGWAALDVVLGGGPTAVERALRRDLDLPDGVSLALHPDPDWPTGTRSVGQLLAHAASLAALLAGGTPLLPDALVRPGAAPCRDLGAAVPELQQRLARATRRLRRTVEATRAAVGAVPPDGIVADEAVAARARAVLRRLTPYGLDPAPTAPDRPRDLGWVRAAWEEAEARATRAEALLAAVRATAEPPAVLLDRLQELAEAVLGAGFVVAPLLAPGPRPDDLGPALTDPAFDAPPASAVRRLVRDHATVRPQVQRWDEVLLAGQALQPGGHAAARPTVAQLAERTDAGGDPDPTGAPAPGTTHWLAGPLPAQGPWPTAPVAHLLLDGLAVGDGSGPLAGWVLDAWVEDLPDQPGPPRDLAAPRPAELEPGRVRTGLAVRANAASARAPHVVLSAVSPDGERWTAESLVSLVTATLDLATVRLLRLDQLPGDGLTLPALYVRSASLQGERVLDFRRLAEAGLDFSALPFVKDGG